MPEQPAGRSYGVVWKLFGEDQLESLISIKSKEELLADIIAMLQAPMQNVISALQSGQNTIAGVVKTLSEKE